MKRRDIYSAAGLEAYIEEVGFLPLLSSGIDGFSAEEVVADIVRDHLFALIMLQHTVGFPLHVLT